MTERVPRRSWPIQPIVDEVERRWQPLQGSRRLQADITIVGKTAGLLGIDRGAVARWLRAGRVSDQWADRCAIRLDLHPVELWPDWLIEVAS